MSSWSSYPKIWAVGHAAAKDIFLDPVVVEEKVDGSQFSWGMFNGELKCRSKGAQLTIEAPEKMFAPAVEYVKSIQHKLVDGHTYRAEFLGRPKHNVLAYSRIPKNGLALFDVNFGLEQYATWSDKAHVAALLEIDVVPLIYSGKVESANQVRDLLKRKSFLGGQNIEGVVIKNYSRFTIDGKAMLAKFVTEEFKEVHSGDWRERNPTRGDIVDQVIEAYKTPTRWAKAAQHLREKGKLSGSPKDIGQLIQEVQDDILEECQEEMKQRLFDQAWGKISRGVISGLPQWYKDVLLKDSFNG